MFKCIFCLTTNSTIFNTKEHIIPESIGGGDWAILPDGLYCDICQNKFGSSIEQQALADYPFINLRTLLGLPTKKRKAPWFKYWEGSMYSGGQPGHIIYEPNDFFINSTMSGQKTITILLAMPKKPDMVLRMLLKIGLEMLAIDGSECVFEERFDSARSYSLTGEKKFPWFYVQKEDMALLGKYINGTAQEEHDLATFIQYEESGLVFLYFKFYCIEFFIPLVENVVLDPSYKIIEPKERLFIV